MSDKEVIERMDIIIDLLIPEFKEEKYDVRGLPLEILKLCDYDHTVKDMVKKLKKPRFQIDNNLSKLRSKNLIKSVNKGENIAYMRLK